MTPFARVPLAALLLAAACFGPAAARPAEAALQREAGFCAGVLKGQTWQRTELFFGRNSPQGEITEQQFQGFLDSVVTPLFPDGLTVLDANGQFRGSATGPVEKEKAKLLILLFPYNANANANVEQIRSAYKQQFQQQSVLRTDVRSCVSF